MKTISLTYVRLDAKRLLRQPPIWLFGVAMPILMNVIFGATAEYGRITVPHGNVGGVVMSSMALYGALVCVTTLSAMAAVEQAQGWGRQLALTPMTPSKYVLNKMLSVQLIGLLAILGVIASGLALGERIDGARLPLVMLVAWLLTIPANFIGLGFGMLIRKDSAAPVVSAFTVLCSFAGNLFVPLEGTMLTAAKFTPFYGMNYLVRYLVTGADVAGTGNATTEALVVAIINFATWTAITIAFALFVSSRVKQER